MPSNHLILCCPFSSFPQSLPMSWVFASGGQSIGALASASVLPMNIQGWFPSGWTGLISLLLKGLSRVFSSTIVQKYQFFGAQPSLWSNSHNSYMTTGKIKALTRRTFVGKVMSLVFNTLSRLVMAILLRSERSSHWLRAHHQQWADMMPGSLTMDFLVFMLSCSVSMRRVGLRHTWRKDALGRRAYVGITPPTQGGTVKRSLLGALRMMGHHHVAWILPEGGYLRSVIHLEGDSGNWMSHLLSQIWTESIDLFCNEIYNWTWCKTYHFQITAHKAYSSHSQTSVFALFRRRVFILETFQFKIFAATALIGGQPVLPLRKG